MLTMMMMKITMMMILIMMMMMMMMMMVMILIMMMRFQLRRELKAFRTMLKTRDFVSVKPKYNHCNYTPPPPFVLDEAPTRQQQLQPDESQRLSEGRVV